MGIIPRETSARATLFIIVVLIFCGSPFFDLLFVKHDKSFQSYHVAGMWMSNGQPESSKNPIMQDNVAGYNHHGIFKEIREPSKNLIINPHLCHQVSIQPHFPVGGENGSCVELGLSPSPLPLTALASFPGSGNTWVRHLIQQITGIYTGSVYADPNLIKNGFPVGQKADGEVVAIKTHFPVFVRYDNVSYDRALVLVRNPYDALRSFYSYNQTGHSHTAVPSTIDLEDWARYMENRLQSWHDFNTYWLNKNICLYILIYDKLLLDFRKELMSLAEFLGVHHLSEEHLDCVISNAEGNFHRKSHMGDLYTDSMRKRVDGRVQEFEDLLHSKLQF